MLIIQSGLIKKWMKDHWPTEGDKCYKSRPKFEHRQTDLSDTFGAYIVLGVGIYLSALVFVIEVIVQKISNIQLKAKDSKLRKNDLIIAKDTPFKRFKGLRWNQPKIT